MRTNIAHDLAGVPRLVDFKHFIDPADKNEKWVLEAVQNIYTVGGCKSLLAGKNVQGIIDYADGQQPTDKYKKIFKSLSRKKKKGRDEAKDLLEDDTNGLDWEPIGILQQPLNAAQAVLKKQPIYVTCTALDGQSVKKRKKDEQFLSNRHLLKNDNDRYAQQLGIAGGIETPGLQYNTSGIDIGQINLDPQNPEERALFMNHFYKLAAETGFESALHALEYQNQLRITRDLKIKDQFYFARSTCRTYFSDVTGLPMTDYIFPGKVYVPKSDLPDYSDVPYMFSEDQYSIERMLNFFGKDGIKEIDIENIFNQYWQALGYDYTWQTAPDDIKQRGLPVLYFEFKTYDVTKVRTHKSADGKVYHNKVDYKYMLVDEDGQLKESSDDDYLNKKYPQQTYYAYWIPHTDRICRFGKVVGSFREKGRESMSPYTFNIWKSQEKSTVELCIPEVDNFQRSYLKMQHAIIRAKPKGGQVDMKYLRRAAINLKDAEYTAQKLLRLWIEENVLITDSEDLDGPQDGNFMPIKELEGGLGKELGGYLTSMASSLARISRLTGINDTLTGQTPSEDALVGVQKILLNSSINSLHYASDAIKNQLLKTFRTYGNFVQYLCRPANRSSASFKALENLVGAQKIENIQYLGDLYLNQFGIVVDDAPTEEEQQELRVMLKELVIADRIELSDYYFLRRIVNYKDAQALLVIREKKRKEEKRNEQMALAQEATKAAMLKEQNKFNIARYMADGEVREQEILRESQRESDQRAAQLEITLASIDAQLKQLLKDKQGQQGIQKIMKKAEMDQVRPLV